MSAPEMIPRLIRLKDAPRYLGMDRHFFNKEIRPMLTQIRIGVQGIAFDRLDLDAWVEHTKCRSGRLTASNHRSVETWDEKERQGSTNVKSFGTLTKKSSDVAFAKALALATSMKRKGI